jgi:hypothetical protein
MANYDSNYAIAQEISARIGASPIPFDSVYSIALKIYNELGGEPAEFDSVYSILLGILPLVEGGGGDSRLVELYLSDDAVEVETYDTNKAFVLVNPDYVEDCDVYAVIWGDGTYIETDGTTITNGDSKKTRMEAFPDSDGTNYYLMHTYDETKSYNIKVNGTYFYATFYIYDTKSSDFPAYVKSLYIDKGVKTLTTYLTAYQSQLAHITFNSECTAALGDYCFCYGGGGINNVFIPDGVTLAGEGQFWNTVVSNFQFGRSNNLTQIPAYFNYGQINWHDWNFLPKLEIPEGVTSIGASAFAANSVYIGDTIRELRLPSTLQTIGNYAFNCMMANDVVVDIPSSVTSIGKSAFFRALYQGSGSTPDGRNIYTVICRCTTLPTLGEKVFYGADYTKPTHCTLYVPNSVIDLYKNAPQWSEFGKILPIESMGLEIATNEEIEQMF